MREIPDPGFAGDDGSADARLRTALARARTTPERAADALAPLVAARLLVPVTAFAGDVEVGPDGLAREKESEMAAVLMRGRDGRLALLAFTGADSMAAWDAAARPVPVAARTAAAAALDDGAEALVVDLAGPAAYVVEGEDLLGLARGWRLARVGDRTAWIRPPGE